jgi:hypothetical protein
MEMAFSTRQKAVMAAVLMLMKKMRRRAWIGPPGQTTKNSAVLRDSRSISNAPP